MGVILFVPVETQHTYKPIMKIENADFLRYPSFQNHYQKRALEAIKAKAGDKTFIATEKLHGSNFAIYFDGENMKCARRNDFLKPKEFFHSGTAIASAMTDKLQKIYDFCKTVTPSDFYVIVYGEIVGDSVQQGISYTKNNQFFAFDICTVYNQDDAVVYKFLNFEDFTKAAEISDLETTPVIAKGTLSDLLELNPEFPSTMLKLPENLAEGYVIKAASEIPYSTAVDDFEIEGLMLKFKNPKFDETVASKPKKKVIDSDVDISFFEKHFTLTRLQAVKSKLSQKQAKNRKFLVDELYKDVLAELSDEEKSELGNVEDACKKAADKFVGQKMKILALSNEEYILAQKWTNAVSKLDIAWFEKASADLEKVHIPQVKALIVEKLNEEIKEKMTKNLNAVVMPVIMEKAKELVKS